MPLLKIEHLSFHYPEAEKPVLSDIHFEVERGEMVCICGPTGSGKSTLLHLIKKEIAPLGVRQGNILFKGKSIDEMPKEELIRSVGIVFQNPESQTVMDTVLGEMAFALENMGLKSGEIRRRV